MKALLLCLVSILPGFVQAQRISFGVEAGGLNYQGELQSMSFSFTGMHLHNGFSVMYDLSDRFAVLSSIIHGNLSGRDRELTRNSRNMSRNLSFNTRIEEFGFQVRSRLLIDRPIVPYFSVGGAVFNINPEAVDSLGVTHALFPLSTEGQGLPEYPNQKAHRYTNLAIPIGGGLECTLGRYFRLDIEVVFRKTFIDDIDDVSSFYPDPAILLKHRGPKAVELSYRGDEVPGGPLVFPANTLRGNSNRMDWYHSFNLRLRVLLHDWRRAKEDRRGERQVGCPGR